MSGGSIHSPQYIYHLHKTQGTESFLKVLETDIDLDDAHLNTRVQISGQNQTSNAP